MTRCPVSDAVMAISIVSRSRSSPITMMSGSSRRAPFSAVANDLVWLVTLCQVLLLNLGESPFYAQYGLPAQQSVIQQVWPDYYVARTQQLFAQYFASLIVSRVPGAKAPTYKINVTTNTGTKINTQVPQ